MTTRRLVVLLRSVNVGGRNKLPMAELRRTLGRHDLGEVETLLQSGNVVVESALGRPAVEGLVAAAIREEFGLDIACVGVEADELAQLLEHSPLEGEPTDPSRLVVAVLRDRPSDELLAVTPLPAPSEELIEIHDRFVYQWCPDGVSKALALAPWLERSWGSTATVRNWRTLRRLSELLAAA